MYSRQNKTIVFKTVLTILETDALGSLAKPLAVIECFLCHKKTTFITDTSTILNIVEVILEYNKYNKVFQNTF